VTNEATLRGGLRVCGSPLYSAVDAHARVPPEWNPCDTNSKAAPLGAAL